MQDTVSLASWAILSQLRRCGYHNLITMSIISPTPMRLRFLYNPVSQLLIDWSDGRVVMALVSGSPEMSLLVRNRVGSNPTLIIILLLLACSVMDKAMVLSCMIWRLLRCKICRIVKPGKTWRGCGGRNMNSFEKKQWTFVWQRTDLL
jgi:hypothetical protein